MSLAGPTTRRVVLTGAAAALGATVRPRRARAATKLNFLTSWFAQAEHGGFYQAQATGLYEKAGLDVTIRMGGPQINGMQLLTAGEVDMVIGYDIQTLNAIEKGLPVVTVGASFQFDLQGLVTHADIGSIGALKGHKILISSSSHLTFWPWLKQRFGFTDDMAGTFTFNLQPFLIDKTIAVQGYATSEPFEARKVEPDVKFFLFADDGYPPYGTTMVTRRDVIAKNPEAVAGFVRASLEGWRDYMNHPEPANVLIQRDNPKMSDDRIAYAIKEMKALKVLNGDAAAKEGIGVMTDARWKGTYDFLVRANLLKPETDWRRAYTLDYVKDLHIMMS